MGKRKYRRFVGNPKEALGAVPPPAVGKTSARPQSQGGRRFAGRLRGGRPSTPLPLSVMPLSRIDGAFLPILSEMACKIRLFASVCAGFCR